MPTVIIKKFIIILFSFILIACSGCEIDSPTQEDGEDSVMSDNNIYHSSVIHLNNLATSFNDYLYVNSMYVDLVFSDKDEYGMYHSWKMPEDLFLGTWRIHNIFKYTDKLVCICTNEEGNDEIIVYNLDFSIFKRKEIDRFSPKYLYGDLLYGFSYPSGSKQITIKAINLDSLESEEIYSYENSKNVDFIVNVSGKVVIVENLEGGNTRYSEYKDGLLSSVLDTNSSSPILYDSRGLFYLEDNNTASEMNLMLWDGNKSNEIVVVKIDDMSDWLFMGGFSGNVIVFDEFFLSIHYAAEDPYLLVQQFNSKDSKKVLLKKWNTTEADIARNGETFSGIYYENGQIINYFFSDTESILQTQVLDIEQ